MSGKTGIQWTDRVWNPTTGCTRVSPGCDHCYAFQLHDQRHLAWKRGKWPAAPAQYHQPFSSVQVLSERLNDPLHWRTPSRVFVDSMADLFHDDVPDVFIAEVFGVMHQAPQHTFQILTKRPENALRVLEKIGSIANVWPLPNVWLGVSVENQAAMDARFPLLVQMPAAVRFLSMEPLLQHVDIATWMWAAYGALRWVIIGGESGTGARPCGESMVEHALNQARAAGAAVFVKQMGSRWAKDNFARDSHGGDPSEWPEYLRVREFPEPVPA